MDHLINNINEALRLEGIRESLKNGKFGIEKENVRDD